MNDKYVRPPMGEPVRRLGPIDILLFAVAIICLVVAMWSLILFTPCEVKDIDEEPIETMAEETVEEPVEEVGTVYTPNGVPFMGAVAVELGSFEVIEEEVIEEPAVVYYDVPLDEQLQDHIFAVCEEYRLDPALVLAVIERESMFRDWVVGDNGHSFGLMQIQKRWHKDRMAKLGVTNLLDPYQNVRVGIDYLAELFDRCQDVEWVLMAYNGGPSYAYNLARKGIVSTYATGVLDGAREIRERSNV